MQKDHRHCLDKLVGAVPERKAALIRSILPGIEAALNSGQSLKKDLGSTGKRRPADGLPRFSQGSLARQKNEETNRLQQWGKTG
jgi:hypothetical protein